MLVPPLWGRGKGRNVSKRPAIPGARKAPGLALIGRLSRRTKARPARAALKVGLSFSFKTKGKHFVGWVATEPEPATWEHTEGLGSGSPRWPWTRAKAWANSAGTEVWGFEVPSSSLFSAQSVQNTHTHTHTHTHYVNTLFGHGSRRVDRSMWGEGTEDGGQTAGCGAVTRSRQAAQAWLLHFNVALQCEEGVSPELEDR